ncbi:hypothetical protein GBA52_022553 [Prunus armeniaca]|nr:hypothetical protein GBA52_022553 [Prunus armeniaca]
MGPIENRTQVYPVKSSRRAVRTTRRIENIKILQQPIPLDFVKSPIYDFALIILCKNSGIYLKLNRKLFHELIFEFPLESLRNLCRRNKCSLRDSNCT